MINAVLRRHRRLLALCALSACAHFALLSWFAARAPAVPDLEPGAGEALRLRLAPPAEHTAPPSGAPAAEEPAEEQRTPPPAQLPAPAAATASKSAAPAPGAAVMEATSTADKAGPRLVQMPGRYRVRLPESVLLRYTFIKIHPGAVPVRSDDAYLDWRTDGDRYRLAVQGALGRLSSEGASGDAGIAPRKAVESTPGGALVTEFDPDTDTVHFGGAGGAGAPGNVGIQDRASLLMQLAGIGLADPDQVKDSIEVVVADAHATSITRLRVLGIERVATGLGQLDAWHLAGAGVPGEPRLDVWLAPQRGWLPVQLRVTGADGTVATQTLAAIDASPAPP